MTEGRRFKRRVIARAAGFGGIVCAGILLFSGRWDMAIGLAVGTAVSAINFHLMATDVFKAVSVRTGKASGVAAGRYFLRYTMLGLLLVALFTRTNIHMVSTLIGLLSVQVVIYGWEIGKVVVGKIMRNEQ